MRSIRSTHYLIDLLVDHCQAFSYHIEPLKAKQYASEFPSELINIFILLNDSIQAKIQLFKTDPDFKSLTFDEASQHINRYFDLYTLLCYSASFIERSDVSHTIVELVQPIKRLMKVKLNIEDCEVLIHPLPVFNYNFHNLGKTLQGVRRRLGITNNKIKFSKHLITIGYPGLETGVTLSHSIIAHELGHCLYMEQNLNKKIKVKPQRKKLNAFIKRISAGKTLDISDKSQITKLINGICESWVKELLCDAIGYCLFGPAFMFAQINLLPIIHSTFDEDSPSHPSARMRLILMFKMLDDESDYQNILRDKAKRHLQNWRKITFSKQPRFSNQFFSLAGQSILDIYDEITITAKNAIGNNRIYSASDHTNEINELVNRAKKFILPNEYIDSGEVKVVCMESILNAGWLAYFEDLGKLQEKYNIKEWECKRKFNDIISRALEMNEVQKRWIEIQ